MVLNKIISKFIFIVVLFVSINTYGIFFEREGSVYFEGPSGVIHDIGISYKDYGAVVSYRLISTSKDNKWAIITWEEGGIGMPTSELNFLYYNPIKIALDGSFHNSQLNGILKNNEGEYIKSKDGGVIYLEEIENKIVDTKYIKKWGMGCSGKFTDYNECGLYLNTETNKNELYVMLNGVGYGFYDETLSETNVSQIKIKPPLISYIYRKSDGYIKNFWHYYSDTKYSINVNKKIKSVFFSHKDFEVERSVSRLVIKEFAKSQEYHFLDKELIGSYLLSENKKGKYNIYIYKQDLNLRFFLFDKNSDLEIMGDVLVDSGHLIFSNAKSNSGLNNIVIKADKSFTSIHLKVNDKHMVFDLSKKLKSDFEY